MGYKDNLLIPGRNYIRHGCVSKISRKRHQSRILILLSDILLYGRRGITDSQIVFHREIPLRTCKIISLVDSDGSQNVFQIVSNEKSFRVYTDSPEEKALWLHAFSDALLKFEAARLSRTVNMTYSPHVVFDAPVWIPDKLTSTCMGCSRLFSVFWRKHHCRACGKIICDSCSQGYFLIPQSDASTRSRACDACYSQILREGKFRTFSQTFERSRFTSMLLDPIWYIFIVSASLGGVKIPTQGPLTCSLCSQEYSFRNRKQCCSGCSRHICGFCCNSILVCDLCRLGIDEEDIRVHPAGGWSYSPRN